MTYLKRNGMQNFIYHNPVTAYFGVNQLQHLSKELGKYGKRVLLTYGGGPTIDVTKFIGTEVFL